METMLTTNEAATDEALAATAAEHRARSAAGRVRKLMLDTRSDRAHVTAARLAACDGLKGQERKDAASDFSAARRVEIADALDGLQVRGLLSNVEFGAKGGQRAAFTGAAIVNDGNGTVKLLLKGEVSIRDTVEKAEGAMFSVALSKRTSVGKDGKVSHRYAVSSSGDATFVNGRKGRMFVTGTLNASEFVRVSVNVVLNGATD
jgi:hypothetical protein